MDTSPSNENSKLAPTRGIGPDLLASWWAGMPLMAAWNSQQPPPAFKWAQDAFEYTNDFWQRSILYLDVLRQRGNNCIARSTEQAPNVLSFEFEVVIVGNTLARPVNYGLVRILPPAGMETKP